MGISGKKYAKISLLVLSACAMMGGCASVSTRVTAADAGPVEDGLIYYMPRRAFKVTVTIDSMGHPTPSVTAADSIPDYSNRYVLKYNRNYAGINHAIIMVDTKGLLQSSNASTTSSVTAIAQSAGTLAGAITAMALTGETKAAPAAPCVIGQSYTLYLFPADLPTKHDLCGFDITGATAFPAKGPGESDSSHLAITTSYQDGIFYKRDLPYIITMTPAGGESSTWLAYSPDQAAVSYYPVSRGAFANAQTNLTLTDGALKQVDASTDSEVLALVSLPAQVLSAYFKAVGDMFTSRATADSNRSTLITDQQALAVNTAKLRGCQAAISVNNLDGKMGADLTTAINNIKTACGT